ncbi:MAG: HIT family protein [Pseudomonadota bacterium]
MAIEGEYDRDNIFAKILRGDAPSVKVHEDEHGLAIMDLFPQSKGHVLVLPKVEARNLFDIEQAALGRLIVSVQKISEAVKKALKPDGVRIMQFNGARAGQTVFHIHFHIIPVYEGVVVGAHASGKQADPLELEDHAALIRKAIFA